MMNLTASQIRQDLNCFGGFGQQGYGYNVSLLRAEIHRILGLDQAFSAILIGAGNLGRALANHIGFIDAGFRLTAIFDINPAIIGTVIAGLPVRDISHLEAYCQEHSVDAAILCTPKEVANATADRLVACGINAFWNFTQSDIALGHPGLVVENAHLTDGLMTLCYQVNDSGAPCRSSSGAIRRVCPACRRLFLKTAQASGARPGWPRRCQEKKTAPPARACLRRSSH